MSSKRLSSTWIVDRTKQDNEKLTMKKTPSQVIEPSEAGIYNKEQIDAQVRSARSSLKLQNITSIGKTLAASIQELQHRMKISKEGFDATMAQQFEQCKRAIQEYEKTDNKEAAEEVLMEIGGIAEAIKERYRRVSCVHRVIAAVKARNGINEVVLRDAGLPDTVIEKIMVDREEN